MTTVRVENGIVFAEMISALIVLGLPVAFFAWLFDAYLVMGVSIGILIFLITLCVIAIVREK